MSTGAPVRDHRNAVRNRSESLAAFNRNGWPHSSESALGQTHATRDVEANTETARRCVRNSLMRGEAPIASHLLYTQPGILHEPRKPIFERTSICGAMGHEPTLPLSRVSELKARHLSPWRTHF